jgi:hypothetical protein
MALDLGYELARVIADARGHGCTSIDLVALDRLMQRHNEALRRHLLAQPGAYDERGMLVVDLHD